MSYVIYLNNTQLAT